MHPDHREINKLPTFAERGAAIAKRLEEVKSNPKYQALPEERKARVRSDIYDKYVSKSYSGFHLPVPDRETWVGATGRDTTFKVEGSAPEKLSDTYKDPRSKQFGQDFIVGANKALDGIALFGARVSNKAFASIFHLNEEYSDRTEHMLQAKVPEYRVAKQVQRKLQNYEDAQRAKVQSENFWLETHPRDTIVGRLGSDAGELIATLPLYEAIGAVGVGSKVFKGATLTQKLAASPVGKFVANRLASSTDMFLAALVESGGSKKAGTGAAVATAVIESAGLGVGKGLKIAAAPIIKKWTANIIAMGGKPFAQDIAQSALAEMWFMKPGKLDDLTIGKNHELTHGIIVHPATETTGHFTDAEMNVYSYGSRETQQKGYEELVRRAEAKRSSNNPIMHKLHQAEKVALDSIAMSKYNLPMHEIPDHQKLEVLGDRWMQIHQAAEEAPVHLPELEAHEVQQSIAKERAANPVFNSLATNLEKFGIKIPEAVSENNIEAIAKETGISNVKAATKKLNKVAAPTKSVGADLNAFHKIQKETYAYYRNNRNRKELADTVGAASTSNYNKLYETLKKADGGLGFEKPLQRLLYHYGNRKQLPPGVANTILNNIRKTKGLEGASVSRVADMAENLHNHMYDMAHSGHLTREGNIYASTKIDGTYTKWQKILSKESDTEVIRAAQMALSKHPRALRGFNTAIKTLQKQSFQAKSPEERAIYKRAIAESSSNILTHMSDKKLGGIIQ